MDLAGLNGTLGTCVRGDLTIDYAQGLVIVAGEPVRLTAIEYDLPRELSIYARRGADPPAPTATGMWQDRSRTPRTVRTHLVQLRRKLGQGARIDARTPGLELAIGAGGDSSAQGAGLLRSGHTDSFGIA